MLTLFQWDLVLEQGVPLGVGIVSDHMRLAEGANIHTSRICRAEQAGDVLRIETFSGSIYHLQMRERSPRAHEAETLDLEQLGLPADFWAQCARASEEASRTEKAELRSRISPGTLFMRIVSTSILSALWMGTDAQIHDASVEIHSGMFQDSYLIRSTCRETEKTGHADIRFFAIPFFPAWARLEPYHISEGIKSLLVRNEGCTNIAVGSESKNILCLPGMTTFIPIRDQSYSSRQLKLF